MKKHIRQFFREYNNPKDYEVWKQAMMAAGDDKYDWTDHNYLEPIRAALKE